MTGPGAAVVAPVSCTACIIGLGVKLGDMDDVFACFVAALAERGNQ